MKKTFIFYLCHGIRTSDYEIKKLYRDFERLSALTFQDETRYNIKVVDGSYGEVGAIASILPPVRNLVIRKVRKEIETLLTNPNTVVIPVTYSFGTFIMSRAIQKLNKRLLAWFLFGGVVHCRYDFMQIKGKVKNVVNFCSTEDEVAKYAPVLFNFGHCGAYGFRYSDGRKADTKYNGTEKVWTIPSVENVRYNNVEHSGSSGWFSKEKYTLLMLQKAKKIINDNL